jgi:hypothetical protein
VRLIQPETMTRIAHTSRQPCTSTGTTGSDSGALAESTRVLASGRRTWMRLARGQSRWLTSPRDDKSHARRPTDPSKVLVAAAMASPGSPSAIARASSAIAV